MGIECSTLKLVTYETPIVGTPKTILWTGSDQNNAVMLTNEQTVYKRLGRATAWVVVELDQKTDRPNEGWEKGLASMVQCKAEPNFIVILGRGLLHWVSEDGGVTFDRRETNLPAQEIRLHPSKPGWLLLRMKTIECYSTEEHQREKCRNELYLSKDGLRSLPTLVRSYVVDMEWGTKLGTDSICWTADPDQSGDQEAHKNAKLSVYCTQDDFKSEDGEPLVTGAYLLKSFSELLFAIKDDEDRGGHQMMVSEDDGKTFFRAEFGVDLPEMKYSMLEAAENSVVVRVDTGMGGGIADAFGAPKFSHSFRRVASAVVQDTSSLHVDWESFRGLDGIYISNQGNNDDPEAETRTMITYDSGGEWQQIEAPEVRQDGSKTDCLLPDCALHLHVVHKIFGRHTEPVLRSNVREAEKWGALLSSHHAIGIAIGSGNIGPRLSEREDEANVYITRDGGHTWTETLKGPHVYDVADHGSLIVAVPNNGKTQELKYSTDEGITWAECTFARSPVEVLAVVASSNSTALQVDLVLEPEISDTTFASSVFHVDFAGVYSRDCGPDDYEMWTPVSPTGRQCLLGQHRQYQRRKERSTCANGAAYEHKTLVDVCNCTLDDWECDHCYTHNEASLVPTCEWDQSCPDEMRPQAPADCSGTYMMKTGWVKVIGTQCQAGEQMGETLADCPPPGPPSPPGESEIDGEAEGGARVMVLLMMLASLAAVGAYVFYRKKNASGIEMFMFGRTNFVGNMGSVQYERLDRQEVNDDDDFGFDPEDDTQHAEVLEDSVIQSLGSTWDPAQAASQPDTTTAKSSTQDTLFEQEFNFDDIVASPTTGTTTTTTTATTTGGLAVKPSSQAELDSFFDDDF